MAKVVTITPVGLGLRQTLYLARSTRLSAFGWAYYDVCERLTSDGQIDARGIKVDAEAGEIILKGIVNNRNAKRLAEKAAESVPGLKAYTIN